MAYYYLIILVCIQIAAGDVTPLSGQYGINGAQYSPIALSMPKALAPNTPVVRTANSVPSTVNQLARTAVNANVYTNTNVASANSAHVSPNAAKSYPNTAQMMASPGANVGHAVETKKSAYFNPNVQQQIRANINTVNLANAQQTLPANQGPLNLAAITGTSANINNLGNVNNYLKGNGVPLTSNYPNGNIGLRNLASGVNTNLANFNMRNGANYLPGNNFLTGNGANYLTVASGTPGNPAIGLNIVAENLEVGGNVAVTGRMPLYGSVSVQGNLPTEGAASVNYVSTSNV